MNTILSLNLVGATLPILRAALKADGSYNGVARLNSPELLAYTARVIAVRTAGYVGDLSIGTIFDIEMDLAEKALDELRAAAAEAAAAAPVYTTAPFATYARPVSKATGSKYARITKADRATIVAAIGYEDCWINEQDRYVGFVKLADGSFEARDIEAGVVAASGVAREKARAACRGIGR